MNQKHFMDIENLREEDTEFRQGNGKGFEVGDIIQITEKIDGSNASCRYDAETDSLVAFSRKQKLAYNKTLSGFWNYVQQLDKTPFKERPSFVVFGEWSQKNKIKYDERFKDKWIVYDIYDTDTEEWLPQNSVKVFCQNAGLEYIHELYYGEFVSWNHCRTFLNSPGYGDRQEGIVCKNMTKLNSDTRLPFYLKIVNEDFKESMKLRDKPDVDQIAEQETAKRIAEAIVTKNRIEKELFKMRDEGIIPEEIQANDMKTVAQNLPKRIYDDCLKEEKELVVAAGKYFGKMCGSYSMKWAREIILGN